VKIRPNPAFSSLSLKQNARADLHGQQQRDYQCDDPAGLAKHRSGMQWQFQHLGMRRATGLQPFGLPND